MKISLLDPGLWQLPGHHVDLDLRLARTLRALGHEAEIFAHWKLPDACVQKIADAGFIVHRIFRADPYKTPEPDMDTLETVHEAARITAIDLANVPESDLWFWPTFTPVQFLAGVRAARGVRMAGGVWYEPNMIFQFGAHCWAQAAKIASKLGKTLLVGAFDDAILHAYRSISGPLELVRLPIPYDGTPRDRSRARLERVGILGYHRESRGMSLLPPLVGALLKRGLEVTLQDSSETLIQGKPHPRLRWLGYVDDFAEEIARCDIVIWPSPKDAYQLKTSGIVFESIASGVPVILPSKCTPAEMMVETGSGVFFHHFSWRSVLEALDEAATTYPLLAQAAQRAAQRWHEREGTRRLVEAITAS